MNTTRIRSAFKAFGIHFGLSLMVAALVAVLVFTIWYPYPFRELAGGRDLFILVIAVDIICGPLLTSILFSPTKPKKELVTDISLVVIVQLLALGYGIWNVWLARPVYLVNDGNRFHVVSRISLDSKYLSNLEPALQPKFFSGPMKVSMREVAFFEQSSVDALTQVGKDKSLLPQLYVPYDGAKAYQNAPSVNALIKVMPNKSAEFESIANKVGVTDTQSLHFAYVLGQDAWFGLLNPAGEIVGYTYSK
ncbi:MAG: pilus assembly protein [Polaromonas sp.]|nr:pilus assembly protein [Polaromonas sp.]